MHDTPFQMRRVFFVVNNRSGNANERAVRAAAEQYLRPQNIDYEFFVRDRKGQSRRKAARQAIRDQVDVVVAVGGDGTVSRIADELRGTNVRLAIVPTGSANLIARSLNLPIDAVECVRMLARPTASRPLDAIQLADRACFSHVSMGVYSQIAGATTASQKKRFGIAAYLWHLAKALYRRQQWTFQLVIDGVPSTVRASLIMVCNVGDSGLGPLKWGEDIAPDDGCLDVCIVRSGALTTYLSLIRNAALGRQSATQKVQYVRSYDHVSIRTESTLPVRGDGKVLGEQTVDLRIIRNAVSVIVPDRSDPDTTDAELTV